MVNNTFQVPSEPEEEGFVLFLRILIFSGVCMIDRVVHGSGV